MDVLVVQCCSLVGVGWFWVNAGVKLRGASERSVVVEGWAMIWTAQRSWCRGPSGVRSHVVQSRRRWLGCVPVATTLCRGFHMKPIKKVDVLSALLAKIWRIVTSRQHAEAFEMGVDMLPS